MNDEFVLGKVVPFLSIQIKVLIKFKYMYNPKKYAKENLRFLGPLYPLVVVVYPFAKKP